MASTRLTIDTMLARDLLEGRPCCASWGTRVAPTSDVRASFQSTQDAAPDCDL